LAPTAASLEAALEAAMRADDAALGAELLERSEARPYPDGSLLKTIEAAKKRFANRTGTIRVDCKGSERCLLSVDGRSTYAARGPAIATVGPHSIVVERGASERFERLIEVTANNTTVVSGPEASSSSPPTAATGSPNTANNNNTSANAAIKQADVATTPSLSSAGPSPIFQPPPQKSQRTLSPVWFWIGAAASVGLGAAATISGIKAAQSHKDFERAGCSPN